VDDLPLNTFDSCHLFSSLRTITRTDLYYLVVVLEFNSMFNSFEDFFLILYDHLIVWYYLIYIFY